jgi:hypothetical protein
MLLGEGAPPRRASAWSSASPARFVLTRLMGSPRSTESALAIPLTFLVVPGVLAPVALAAPRTCPPPREPGRPDRVDPATDGDAAAAQLEARRIATRLVVDSGPWPESKPGPTAARSRRPTPEWRASLTPGAVSRPARRRAPSAPFTGKYWDHHALGDYSLRRVRQPALRLEDEVRLRDGLAELLDALFRQSV